MSPYVAHFFVGSGLHVCRAFDNKRRLVRQGLLGGVGGLPARLPLPGGRLHPRRLHRREQPARGLPVPRPRRRHDLRIRDLELRVRLDAARGYRSGSA